MSMSVELTLDDYSRILAWYELTFASGKKKANAEDDATFRKLTVMAMTKTEEMKEDSKV